MILREDFRRPTKSFSLTTENVQLFKQRFRAVLVSDRNLVVESDITEIVALLNNPKPPKKQKNCWTTSYFESFEKKVI